MFEITNDFVRYLIMRESATAAAIAPNLPPRINYLVLASSGGDAQGE
jgi:hypothetical protein